MHRPSRFPGAAFLAALLLCLLPAVALAAPGDLDSTFDGDGRLQTVVGTRSSVLDIARQADGKLVAAGFSESGGSTTFAVARYNPDGSLDTTFDMDGIATVAFTQGASFGQAVAIQPDGRILVGGYIGAAGDQFAVARLNANGTLDTTFGTMGRVAFTVAGTTGSLLTDLLLRPDGRIVLAGSGNTATQSVIAAAQLLANGALDTSFSGDGMALLTPGGDSFTGEAALQADGKLLVSAFNGSRFIVGRFNADGSVDTGFGSAGVAIADNAAGESLMGLVVQPDGRIVLAASNSAPDITIVRFTTAGLLDGSFGSGGVNTLSIGGIDVVGDLLLMPDGKLVVVGSAFNGSIYEAFIARFNANGLVDTTYGMGGHVTLAHEAGSFFVNTGLRQPDGRIVMGGQYRDHFALMRALGDPAAAPAAAPDFNGDLRADLLWRNTDGRAAIWLMNGLAATATQEIIGAGTGWSVAHVADMDGNGRTDLVWQHTDGRVAIYLMNGTAVVATQQVLNAGPWTVTQAPDLNGDGMADLVFRNADGTIAAWLMNGTTVTAGATLLGPGSGWNVVRTADFDGDGMDDLLWMHADGRVAIWLMNGLAVKATGQVQNAGAPWTPTHTPDLNGDGMADIVWRHTDGSIAVWLMNGTAFAAGTTLLGPGTGWSVARTGDFDGNGRGDLLFSHADGRAAIWLMNGTAVTATAQILNAGGGWTPQRTEDLDGDGMADIVWQNADGSSAAWLMTGTTVKAGSGLLGTGTGWSVSPVSQ